MHEVVVAPFMGAWIETIPLGISVGILGLLPLWEHGLKHLAERWIDLRGTLLPLWEHGLKQQFRTLGYYATKSCSLYGSMD